MLKDSVCQGKKRKKKKRKEKKNRLTAAQISSELTVFFFFSPLRKIPPKKKTYLQPNLSSTPTIPHLPPPKLNSQSNLEQATNQPVVTRAYSFFFPPFLVLFSFLSFVLSFRTDISTHRHTHHFPILS